MTHRWTASFAYNLFNAIDWPRVLKLRRIVDVERG